MVDKLKTDLVALQPQLDQAAEETDALLLVLEKDQTEANIQKESCAKDAKECQAVTARVSFI